MKCVYYERQTEGVFFIQLNLYLVMMCRIVGGYTDQDPTKREYFQIATFAVSEYNKQKNLGFILESVFRAQTQVVSGVNYKVAFTVRDNRPGNPSSNFEAVVYSKAAPTLLELISFDPLLK